MDEKGILNVVRRTAENLIYRAVGYHWPLVQDLSSTRLPRPLPPLRLDFNYETVKPRARKLLRFEPGPAPVNMACQLNSIATLPLIQDTARALRSMCERFSFANWISTPDTLAMSLRTLCISPPRSRSTKARLEGGGRFCAGRPRVEARGSSYFSPFPPRHR